MKKVKISYENCAAVMQTMVRLAKETMAT